MPKKLRLKAPKTISIGHKQIDLLFGKIINRIHDFVSNKSIELKFSGIPSNIFEETRKFVDLKLMENCPSSVEKFSAAYESLRSSNTEDWSQAMLSCRRIIEDFANSVQPPKDEKYLNRLKAFIDIKIESERNKELLKSILENTYNLSCKGTHGSVTQDEANRCVIYTYLLLGDIIKLAKI